MIVEALESVVVIKFLKKFRLENRSFQILCFKRITQYHQQFLSDFLMAFQSVFGGSGYF